METKISYGAGKNGLFTQVEVDGQLIENDVYTYSEVMAFALCCQVGWMSWQTGRADYHEAGNKIIAFAERIKADRAILAMNKE